MKEIISVFSGVRCELKENNQSCSYRPTNITGYIITLNEEYIHSGRYLSI